MPRLLIPRNLTTKIVINSAILCLLLIAVMVFKFQLDTNQLMREKETLLTHASLDNISRRTVVIYQLLEVVLEQIVLNEKIIEAFANGDREELARVTAPVMENLTAKGITLFHFHLPNNVTFFRAHLPDDYGDDLSELRQMVATANKEQQAIKGLEQGVKQLAYRYIVPVYHLGNFIGSIELGMYFDQSILDIWQQAAGGEWYLMELENKTDLQLLVGTGDPFSLELSQETFAMLTANERAFLQLTPYTVQMVPLQDYSGKVNWVIKRVVDNSELFAMEKRQRAGSILFGITVAIICCLVILYLTKYLLKPLAYLVEKTKDFAGGDLTQPVQVTTEDEIGQLAMTMEIMRQSIQESERDLKESQDLFKTLADFATDWIFWLSKSGEIIYNSPAVERITGYTTTELMDKPELMNEMIHPQDQDKWQAHLSQIKTQADPVYMKFRIITKSGQLKWINHICRPVYSEAGEFIGVRGSNTDITNRVEVEENLIYLSRHDKLTGLYNRAFYEEELTRLQDCRAYPISIISADLDCLKLINDSIGHQRGDDLIKACARVLKEPLGKADFMARVGGDEFIGVLPWTGEERAQEIVARIREAIAKHNRDYCQLPLSISIGFATCLNEEQRIADTIKQADNIMYRNKLNNSAKTKEQLIESMLLALAERDYYAQGHPEQLANYCGRLGEQIGLGKEQLSRLAVLAKVHDLGKVGIPEHILFKNGTLTAREWEVNRQHPEIGYRIAGFYPDLAQVADLILRHHEKWDGSGYPLGLKGENIAVENRIFAIVDAFDSMTQPRSYRNPKNWQDGLKELQECAGSKFDPDLVQEFIKLVKLEKVEKFLPGEQA